MTKMVFRMLRSLSVNILALLLFFKRSRAQSNTQDDWKLGRGARPRLRNEKVPELLYGAWSYVGNSSKLFQKASRDRRQVVKWMMEHTKPLEDSNYMFRRTLGGWRDDKLPVLDEIPPFDKNIQNGAAMIAISNGAGHDASVAISQNGRIQCVLEFERFTETRYATLPKSVDVFERALLLVRDRCDCDIDTGGCPRSFEYGVLVDLSFFYIDGFNIPAVVDKIFPTKHWGLVDHHVAHASSGYFASPFRSALVISYDGGGNDGAFHAYVGMGMEMHHIANFKYNFGETYNLLASFITEVTGVALDEMCFEFSNFSDVWNFSHGRLERQVWDSSSNELSNWTVILGKLPFKISNAGKLMGYAALGNATSDMTAWARTAFEKALGNPILGQERVPRYAVPTPIVNIACKSVDGQRALAASIQAAFEDLIVDISIELLKHIRDVEGIVLSGGCALNVLANQKVYDTLTAAGSSKTLSGQKRLPLKVYVPPAPNDAGLAVGALWAVDPPLIPQSVQYLGFRLWDEEILDKAADEWGARKLSALGGIEYLADLLAGGPAWLHDANSNRSAKPIVAVVIGRQEFGPRALGHRSLFAVPDSDIKDRMNRLKHREWYRPVAPIFADEALEEVFGRDVKSPYMSMAPRIRATIRAQFPGLGHLDGTARHQSVGESDEPWIHALLLAVGKRTGLAALINTSFNTKGKPLVNTVRASLDMLEEMPDLDFVLIEDWLFRKRKQLSHGENFNHGPDRRTLSQATGIKPMKVIGPYAGIMPLEGNLF